MLYRAFQLCSFLFLTHTVWFYQEISVAECVMLLLFLPLNLTFRSRVAIAGHVRSCKFALCTSKSLHDGLLGAAPLDLQICEGNRIPSSFSAPLVKTMNV